MITIKEHLNSNSISIKYSPPLDWKEKILLMLFLGFLLYIIFNIIVLGIKIVVILLSTVIFYLLWRFFDRRKGTQELTFENQFITYTGEIAERFSLKEAIKISINTKCKYRGRRLQYYFSFNLAAKNKFISIYNDLDYNDASKLSILLYKLSQQNNLLLDESSKFMAKNPIRTSRGSIAIISGIIWIFILENKKFPISFINDDKFILLILTILIPPILIDYCYYKFNLWRGRFYTADKIGYEMMFLQHKRAAKDALIIFIERKTKYWPYNDQQEFFTYLTKLSENDPIIMKKEIIQYAIDRNRIESLFAEKDELVLTSVQLRYLIAFIGDKMI